METTHQVTTLSGLFSVISYGYFFAILCAYFLFMLPRGALPTPLQSITPYSIDTAPTYSFLDAILLDVFLLLAFCIPHSVLARPAIKRRMSLPHRWERPIYIFQSAMFLHLQMHNWRNFEGPTLYDVTHQPQTSVAILTLFTVGFLFLVTASFALDHFSLGGLTQGLGIDLNRAVGLADAKNESGFTVRWNYTLVAHPIMTGMLMGMWASPILSTPKLLLAAFDTAYIILAVRLLEEPDLEKEIGHEYSEYLKTVPRFCPFASPTKLSGGNVEPDSMTERRSTIGLQETKEAPDGNSDEASPLALAPPNRLPKDYRQQVSNNTQEKSKCPFH